MKKEIVFGVLVSVSVLICVCMALARREPAVMQGISLGEAKKKAEEPNHFIIGRFSDKEYYEAGGSQYDYYLQGNEKIPVYLIGLGPSDQLSGRLWRRESQFLVEGSLEPELSAYAGEAVLRISAWTYITPIWRRYSDEYSGGRILYPLSYIDQYDVEHGDVYFPGEKARRALTHLETSYALECLPNYHLVTAKQIDDQTVWYFAEELSEEMPIDITKQVLLSGNSPERYLTEIFFQDKKRDHTVGDRYQRNYFLVQGSFDMQTNTLQVKEWDFVITIQRMYPAGEKGESRPRPANGYATESFLDQYDIDRGDYFPDGNIEK